MHYVCFTASLGYDHQQLLLDRRRQLYAAQLDASAPAGDIFREEGQQYVSELLDFLVGVIVGFSADIRVKLLIVVILDFVAYRGEEGVALAGDVHAAALLFRLVESRLLDTFGSRFPARMAVVKIQYQSDGDKRAEAVAEASLRSPLLDHNLISGAKNILLNISVSDADALMYEEVVQILEYIQAHASVQDDNGVIHNANIIWGTSEKPQLGNFIELVVVATGFEGDTQPGVMKQIIPPVRTVEPAVKETSAAAPVLEPIKPLPPKPAQRQPELVMLGAKPTRYSNIDTLLAKPAYQSRNSKFVVRVPGSRKEVLKDDTTDAQAQKEESQGGSLFD